MNFIRSIRVFSDWSFQKLTLFFSGEPYHGSFFSQVEKYAFDSHQSPDNQWVLHQNYSDIYRQDMICIMEKVTPAGIKKRLKRFSDDIHVTLMEEELFNIEINVEQLLNMFELNKKINKISLSESHKNRTANCYTHFIKCWKKIFRPSPEYIERLTFRQVRDQNHAFRWPLKTVRISDTLGFERPRPGSFKLILSFIYHKRI